MGPQGAGGSTSMPDGWADLRQAGARARAMLRAGGCREMADRRGDVTTGSGHVLHPDGRRLSYGAVAGAAALLAPPTAAVALKKPADYRIIGRPTRTVDAEEIVTGRARYGLDATLPGALVAVMERCPYFTGGLASYDASAARAVPGVRDVVVLPGPEAGRALSANLATGVAVIADDTWSALKGRRALKVEWTHGPYADESAARSMRSARSSWPGRAAACAKTAISTAPAPRQRESSRRGTACRSCRIVRSSRRTPARTSRRTRSPSSRRCKAPAARRGSCTS